MEYILYIAVGAFAFFAGRALAVRRAVSKDKMAKMRQKGIQKKREKRKDRKQTILEHAQKHGRVTNDEVEQMFCVSNSTAENYLDQLEKEGKLKQIGKGRGVHYIPA